MSRLSMFALGAVSLSLFAAAGLTSAAADTVSQPVTVAQLKTKGAQPGDCKRSYASAMGQSAAMAQTLWVANVNAKFGANWAHWVGAKNKAIIPHASGSGTQYEARAIPCFYHPVP